MSLIDIDCKYFYVEREATMYHVALPEKPHVQMGLKMLSKQLQIYADVQITFYN